MCMRMAGFDFRYDQSSTFLYVQHFKSLINNACGQAIEKYVSHAHGAG